MSPKLLPLLHSAFTYFMCAYRVLFFDRLHLLPLKRCHVCIFIFFLRFRLFYCLYFAVSVDPYTQWYQLMQNYYKQFYPGFEFGTTNAAHQQPRAQRRLPVSAVPLTQSAGHQQQASQQHVPPMNFPGWPPMPQGRPGLPGGPMTNLPPMQMPGFGQGSDYAAYYYQYYIGAWAAANGWPVPTGRTTPKIYIEPHIRATLATPGLLIQVSNGHEMVIFDVIFPMLF